MQTFKHEIHHVEVFDQDLPILVCDFGHVTMLTANSLNGVEFIHRELFLQQMVQLVETEIRKPTMICLDGRTLLAWMQGEEVCIVESPFSGDPFSSKEGEIEGQLRRTSEQLDKILKTVPMET